jgi:peptide/nickel transport system ATP-binding protein
MSELLKVQDLYVYFHTPRGVVKANKGVNLEINEASCTGLMGESGCGKTVLLLSILHLQQPGRMVKGSVSLDGRDITRLKERDMQLIRGRQIALIPQNQATALNPAYTVREQLNEAVELRRDSGGLWLTLPWKSYQPDANALQEIEEVLWEVGFNDSETIHRLLGSYPHQLSGGIRQRVLITMALLMQPRLIIADEPTTALDQATKAVSLRLLQKLRHKTTLMVVSHDLQTISSTCDYVAIMYGGRIVERGPAREVLESPRHPYSQILLSCQKRQRGEPLVVPGIDTLDLIDFPPGCSFHPACPDAMLHCSRTEPTERRVGNVIVACHLFNGEASNC